MDLEFNSLEELYRRIKPALRTKREEMKKKRFSLYKRRRYLELLERNKMG